MGVSAPFLQAMMSSPVNNEGDRRTNTGSGVQTTALRAHTPSLMRPLAVQSQTCRYAARMLTGFQ